jgi:hypothetical protein
MVERNDNPIREALFPKHNYRVESHATGAESTKCPGEQIPLVIILPVIT